MDLDYMVELMRGLLASRDYATLRLELQRLPSADVADIMSELEEKEAAVLFRTLTKEDAARVFADMRKQEQQELINSFSDKEVLALVEDMHMDEAVDFLEELPANAVSRILRLSTPEKRALLNRYMEYPEDSAGSIMTAEFLSLDGSVTVGQALHLIRNKKRKIAAEHVVYITNESRKLEGSVSLHTILVSKDQEVLRTLIRKTPLSVHTDADAEEVLNIFRHHNLSALAVVDSENRIVGVITADDILDLADKEASEDVELMAAMQPMEEDYLETTVWQHAKNRLPWLMVLLLSGMLNGIILGGFEATFMMFPILITFIPMLTDTGGNAGSQSSTLVIRGMAMGDISLSDVMKVLRKEMAISLIVGLGVGLVTFGRVLMMKDGNVMVALTVTLGIFFIVVLSKLLGGILPMAAKKVGVDPALMAAPMVTTVVDAVGLIVYFSVAKVLLGL